MSFEDFPDYILFSIFGYLKTNKDILVLNETCTRFRDLNKSYGYLRTVKWTNNSDPIEMIQLIGNHKRTLKYLFMSAWLDVNEWVYYWPEKVTLFSNVITSPIAPPKNVTKKLKVIEYRNNIQIEWGNLPHLEELRVDAQSLDTTGIEKCTKLRVIIIQQSKPKQLNPKICQLPNLEKLITNQSLQAFDFKSTNIFSVLTPNYHRTKRRITLTYRNYVNASCYMSI